MKLVLVDGKTLIKILNKKGFTFKRQKGSHAQLEDNEDRRVTVPIHMKEIGRWLLSRILRDAEISRDEYEKLRREV
ncbi:MAG: type II toxin-antitoxin system HicA family toxin [Candidatus Aenigmarchaeota archaeon]|nr:type II toxin-antitoxin system HicA family toxin [Candidatus Aenigmarchaeota archaeon]